VGEFQEVKIVSTVQRKWTSPDLPIGQPRKQVLPTTVRSLTHASSNPKTDPLGPFAYTLPKGTALVQKKKKLSSLNIKSI
jgi:hypothetical protein